MSEKPSEKKTVEVQFPSNGTRKCPYCQKDVEPNATTCPYCHHSFFTTNPLSNAILYIIVFIILYFLLSKFVSCEADREMDRINQKVQQMGF